MTAASPHEKRTGKENPTWSLAVILSASNGDWSWAQERLLGLSILERLLITLHRAGIQRVLIPSSGELLKRTADGLPDGRRRPQILCPSDSKIFFDTSPVLWIQGGVLFDKHFFQWFHRCVQEAAGGEATAATQEEHPVAASILLDGAYGVEPESLNDITLPELCGGKKIVSVPIPPDSLCRPIASLKAPGGDRALLLSVEKPSDRWHVRWVRNWSFPLLRLFAERGTDPNRITWLGFAVGLSGCLLLLLQGYAWGILGAVFLYFSWVFDCMDGTLARLTFAESLRGALLDTRLGHLINMAVFCSLVWRVYGRVSLIDAGVLSMVFVGSILLAHRVSQAERRMRPARVPGNRRLQSFLDKINHRDSAVWIILFSLLDGFKFLLWGSLMGLQVFWLLHFTLILRHRHRRRHSKAAAGPA